ncbi:hypothetical protein FOZ60_000713 [Perkinsus olseni]|uniref:Gag/pol/env polyprotein n=1 Tax=Perkinsus olseni TaxID=32597 RepID=A0A7J6P1T3_PEROL|nr:hypothetical protein FOZ60_000713 [Perkinsus olseni]
MIIGLSGLRLMDMAICVSLTTTVLRCDASSQDQAAKGSQDHVNHVAQEPSDSGDEDHSIDDDDSDKGPIFLCSLQPSEDHDNDDDCDPVKKCFTGYTVDCSPQALNGDSSSEISVTRYTFNLPWLSNKRPETFRLSDIPNVVKRDERLIRSLKRNKCYDCYKKLIDDYLAKDIIRKTDVSGVKLLLPHFAVLKDSLTTPCRPVFDGRIFQNLLSKGDVGPISCTPSLLAMRCYKYVTLLDSHRAFLMIQLSEASKPWVSFYFEGEYYQFNRVVMGLPPSHAILRYCTSEMVSEVHSRTAVAHDYSVVDYVDDLVVGSNDSTTRDTVVVETRSVFGSHGFWLDPAKECQEGHSGRVKAFGMLWDGPTDSLQVTPIRELPSPVFQHVDPPINLESSDVPNLSSNDFQSVSPLTLREALSWLASNYDPLGAVAETVLRGKLVLRYAHRCGITFDQLLPGPLYREFYKVYQALKSPKPVPRLVDHQVLHVFVDSSSYAHGCSVPDSNMNRVYAKAMLHELPHLPWTIVRKELLSLRYGLSFVKQQVLPSLPEQEASRELYVYTDNSANFQRVRKALRDGAPSPDLPAWEKTCIASIIELANDLHLTLRFIPGPLNPADCLSRGSSDGVDYQCLRTTITAMNEGKVDPLQIPVALTATGNASPLLSHLKNQCSATEIADVLERIRRAQERDDEVTHIKLAIVHNDNRYKDMYHVIHDQNGDVLVKKHPIIADHVQVYVPQSCRRSLVDRIHTVYGHVGPFVSPSLADDPEHKVEYALVLVDSASKFIVAKPLFSSDTDSTLETMVDCFFSVGFPSLIVSDRDGRFLSKVGVAAQKLFQWNWKFLPAHASPLNSWQEIPHRLLNSIMRAIIDGSGLQLRDWYRLLPCAVWAYNNVPIDENCPVAPADLFFHHGATAPSSLQPRRLSEQAAQWSSVLQGFPASLQRDVVQSMVKNMERVYASTFDIYTIHNYVLRNKSEASLARQPGRRVPELRVGQHVMLVRHQRRKLDPLMTGPFRICGIVTKYLVELEDKDHKKLGRHFVGNLRLLPDDADIPLATATSTDLQ